jgi:Rgg/GadR/MutR family transcriptional activator
MMNKQDVSHESLTLGRYYKQIRERRGYTYADIASDYLHTSQISRFEKGVNMFSATCLLLAIQGLDMTPAEFFALMPQDQFSRHYRIIKEMSHYAMVSNPSDMEYLKIQDPKKQIDKIYNIIVKLAGAKEIGNSAITSQERHYIYHYLSSIQRWTVLDIQIFSSCLSVLELKEAFLFGLDILKCDDLSNLLGLHASEVKKALIHLYMHLVYGEYYSRADHIKAELDALLVASDMEEKIMLHVFDCLAQYKQNKDRNNLGELENCMQVLHACDLSGIAKRISDVIIKT